MFVLHAHLWAPAMKSNDHARKIIVSRNFRMKLKFYDIVWLKQIDSGLFFSAMMSLFWKLINIFREGKILGLLKTLDYHEKPALQKNRLT